MFAAIEAGGTKFNLGLGNERAELLETKSFPTRSPQDCLEEIYDFFKDKEVDAFGIGLFGPVDLKPSSESYGHFLNTPKDAWAHFDFLSAMKKIKPKAKYFLETDVNLAGLGEYYLGNGRKKDSLLYLTVGTGIGGGFIQKGRAHHGLGHPEMGHLPVRPHPEDTYPGACPYHKQCLEGMASGQSIFARYGLYGQDLAQDHPVWTFIADYLAQAVQAYTCILRPDQITLGGGVMKHPGLLEAVRKNFTENFKDYLDLPSPEDYLQLPYLGDRSALKGGLVLALPVEERKKLSRIWREEG